MRLRHDLTMIPVPAYQPTSNALRRVPTEDLLQDGRPEVCLFMIAWRAFEISQRWTQLPRSERRRNGTARRLWILNLIHLFPRRNDGTMPTASNKLSKETLRHEIVTTFGKLDTSDIEKVVRSPEQLVAVLIDHYGWSQTHAQAKVDHFLERISANE